EFVEPSSINENKLSGTLSVYPNPGTGKFKIQMDNGQLSLDNYQLSIYNVLGEKIFQSEIKNLKTEIDISHQPNGIYIIRVNDGIQSLNQHLIKQ
ncbi:MAG: T9SS type A sorting domain-containing protein, partial [Bacteroidota bacterium]|nr:T9SS type A sorting domain-containing protein [Bacteroidota bacterium]